MTITINGPERLWCEQLRCFDVLLALKQYFTVTTVVILSGGPVGTKPRSAI